jgi:predicted metal-dependent HD superfamily phosphohydrolase
MNLQNILNKFDICVDVNLILEKWNESHRTYHNLNHLTDIISQIMEDYGHGIINELQKDKLVLAALFHGIVCDPNSQTNEENSAEFFYRLCRNQLNVDLIDVKQIILDTKNYIPSSELSDKFIKYDLNVCEGSFEQLLEWEINLREEYSFLPSQEYKNKRITILESLLDLYPSNTDNLLDLINWCHKNY